MLSDSEYRDIIFSDLEKWIKESEVLEMYKDYTWELINQGAFDNIDPNVAFQWMKRTLKFISKDDYNNVDSLELYIRSVYENDYGCLFYLGKFKE